MKQEHQSPPVPLDALDLGFEPVEGGWRRKIGEQSVVFRPLRTVPELLPLEALQREIFGVSERDLTAASLLVVVEETGGDVLGVFAADPDAPGDDPPTVLAGFVVGWGGFVDGRPRLVSDLLGVRPAFRNLGLGSQLKRLQAVRALARGLVEIVWTVDPLRAANARLNFEKLGAIADRYEIDRYGDTFGSGLYGGLPTDRLHVTWPLTDPSVRQRLLGRVPATTVADIAELRHYEPATTEHRALVYLPSDVDRLMAWDPNAVLRWRLTLRETLVRAFAERFAIAGFVPDVAPDRDLSAFVIERR